MTDIEFVPILVLGLVVYTLTNAIKYLRAQDWSALVTLLAAWVVGVLAVWLVGATDWGASITVGGGKALDSLSFPETMLVGLVVAAAGSGFYDIKRSIDSSDSSKTPPLLGPPKPDQPVQ